MGPPGAATAPRLVLRQLLGNLKVERPVMLAALALNAVGVLLTISGPRLLGHATNIVFEGIVGKRLPTGMSKSQVLAHLRATGQGRLADLLGPMNVIPGAGVNWSAFRTSIVVVLAAYLLGSVFSWAQGYLLAGVAQRTVAKLRTDVETKIHRVPLSYLDSQERGELLSRVTNDIDNIGTTLQQGMGQLLNSVLTIIGVIGLMFWISPLLAAISLLVLPASGLVTWLIARRSQREFSDQWARTGRLNAHVEGVHSGHTIIQVFGATQHAKAAFDEQNQALYHASFRAQVLSGIVQPAMGFIGYLHFVAIAVIGGYRVAAGGLLLGDLQAFIQYSRTFTMPITQIASQLNLLQSGLASAERVFDLLDAPEEVELEGAPEIELSNLGQISFDGVDFAYREAEPVITGLDLVIERGQTIAIVGPTGAGKTTLVNLLLRFYDVSAGSIRIDGIDIRTLPRKQLRQIYAMVLQETWLFAGTIRENVAYGRLGASDAEILDACRAARVDRFVRTLPAGLDTVIDESAENISSGEKQLITIARAFLADPSVLILDEATSNVDTRTEVVIQEAMSQLRHGRTSFVIAHRLSTIRGADLIVVLDHGRVVEAGRHEELLLAEGAYHRLYARQFSGSRDSADWL